MEQKTENKLSEKINKELNLSKEISSLKKEVESNKIEIDSIKQLTNERIRRLMEDFETTKILIQYALSKIDLPILTTNIEYDSKILLSQKIQLQVQQRILDIIPTKDFPLKINGSIYHS